MWRYDPQEFITKLRKKVKLGPHIHHSLRKIERHANQFHWLENTLIDKDRIKVDVENALIYLERQFDESSFMLPLCCSLDYFPHFEEFS